MKTEVSGQAARRYHVLDLARFVAAFSVVLFHYLFRGWVTDGQSPLRFPNVGPYYRYGYLGVQLFFMISGFVIFMSASGSSPAKLVKARFLRLFPAYWFAVVLTAAVVAAWGGPVLRVGIAQASVNLTMLQQVVHVPHVDGVYWTLSFELVFYVWIFLLIAFGRMRHFETWCLAMLLISTAAQWIHEPGWLRLLTLADYSPYFISGALYYRWCVSPLRPGQTALLWWAGALTIVQATGEAPLQSARYATEMSPWVIAATMAACHLFFVSVATGQWRHFSWSRAPAIGALTYPLYLVHQNIGYTVFNAFPSDRWSALTVGATVVGAVAAAAIIAHLWEPFARSSLSRAIESNRIRRTESPSGPQS
jgi:peptidoglycan/LPS O-acetylase OafA/YrhL